MKDWQDALAIWLMNDAPPTKVFLPRLDEKRVHSVKNPLYHFYKLFKDIDLQEVITDVLGKEVTVIAALPESSMDISNRVFKKWVERLVELNVPTRVFRHREKEKLERSKRSKSVTKIEILLSKEELAAANLLPDEKHLQDWKKRELIKTRGKIGLLRPGMLIADTETIPLIYSSFEDDPDEVENQEVKPVTKQITQPTTKQSESKVIDISSKPKPIRETSKPKQPVKTGSAQSGKTEGFTRAKKVSGKTKQVKAVKTTETSKFSKEKSARNSKQAKPKTKPTEVNTRSSVASNSTTEAIIGSKEIENDLLANFLARYQLRLEGHPARKYIPEEERLPAIGIYRPAVHYYSSKPCRELARWKSFTKRFSGKPKRVIAVPQQLAQVLNQKNLLAKELCLGEDKIVIAVLPQYLELVPQQLQQEKIKTFKIAGEKQKCLVLE